MNGESVADWSRHILGLASYWSVAAFCLWAWHTGRRAMGAGICTHRSPLWITGASLLLVVGLNKVLRLSDAASDLLRALARSAGWYEHRTTLQDTAMLLVVSFALAGLTAALLWMRRAPLRHLLATAALLAIAALVPVSVISSHRVDVMLGTQLGPLSLKNAMELTALAALSLAAHRQVSVARCDMTASAVTEELFQRINDLRRAERQLRSDAQTQQTS